RNTAGSTTASSNACCIRAAKRRSIDHSLPGTHSPEGLSPKRLAASKAKGNSRTTMPPAMKIAYLTAGAAGMICGSCLHDNTLAAELIAQGHDALLIPTYTPIRTDEP